jgi:dTDP-4-amino-4,6-dideoxygalactose transaminase
MFEIKSTWPDTSPNLINRLSKVLKSNKHNYHIGDRGKLFEKLFSNYHSNLFSCAISNATIGLEIALIALDIKKGDEVIVTPRTYYTSVSCILRVGAKPVFADIEETTLNIDPKSVISKISSKTKAIICVHLSGNPCDMFEFLKIKKKHNIKIIEDCSQSHGASIDKKIVGSFGDVAVWSFCNDKIISTLGEGGMISTNSNKIFKKIWSLKDNGKNYNKFISRNKNKNNKFIFLHDFIGTNARLTELQSEAGIYHLEKLNFYIKRRNENAQIYLNAFKNINFIDPLFVSKNIVNAYYRFTFLINLKLIKKKFPYQKILNDLSSLVNNVTVGSCPSILNELTFNKLSKSNNLPVALSVGKRVISLAVDQTISKKSIKQNSLIIKEYFEKISI